MSLPGVHTKVQREPSHRYMIYRYARRPSCSGAVRCVVGEGATPGGEDAQSLLGTQFRTRVYLPTVPMLQLPTRALLHRRLERPASAPRVRACTHTPAGARSHMHALHPWLITIHTGRSPASMPGTYRQARPLPQAPPQAPSPCSASARGTSGCACLWRGR